jgi:hypothetical protein
MFAGRLMRECSAVFLALPSAALASGNDVLVSFWSQLALLAVVVLSLFITRLILKSQALVFGEVVHGTTPLRRRGLNSVD